MLKHEAQALSEPRILQCQLRLSYLSLFFWLLETNPRDKSRGHTNCHQQWYRIGGIHYNGHNCQNIQSLLYLDEIILFNCEIKDSGIFCCRLVWSHTVTTCEGVCWSYDELPFLNSWKEPPVPTPPSHQWALPHPSTETIWNCHANSQIPCSPSPLGSKWARWTLEPW